MVKKKQNAIKKIVRDGYAKVAIQGTSCCATSSCCSTSSCCESTNQAQEISKTIGYSQNEMNAVPEGANLGLGCGNPVAIASLKKGEVVLDLGSGAGFDAFIASRKVGKTGRVIGVDMTPEMIKRAKENAKKGNYKNVEFRLGEIEKLPIEDNSIDVIISNCVINLSPDKESVFKEAFRVLKQGGRLTVSDLVLTKKLPDIIKESVEAYVGCLAGAIMKDEYMGFIKKAGFQDIKIVSQSNYPIGFGTQLLDSKSNRGVVKGNTEFPLKGDSEAPEGQSPYGQDRARSAYLVEAMANDITAQIVKNNSNINEKVLKGVENSVASIKIHAIKKRRG